MIPQRTVPLCTSCLTSFAGRGKLLTRILFLVLLLLGAAVSQTDKASSRKDDSIYAELAKAPQKEVDRRNPLENDPDAVAGGAKLFARHCAECHGQTADGAKKGPSLRAPEVQQASSGAIFWLLTNGVVRRGMPVWSRLPEPQRWQLVSYIKSLTPATRPDTQVKSAPASERR